MRVLILGAGPAGLTVAERLRELTPDLDQQCDITMVSAEPFPPYSPPAMADYLLSGDSERLFWKGEDICGRLGIDYRSAVQAQHLDAEKRQVELTDGTRLPYDRLVLATGSHPYAPLPGNDLQDVYNFKSLTAANALVQRTRLGEVTSAVVVGAGFIGVEVALLLNDLGLDVTVIEQQTVMSRMLDHESAEIVRQTLVARGITVHLQTTALSFCDLEGRAIGVVLDNGDMLKANVYIAATGIKPNVEYLKDSGIDLNWGVPVDETLATNLPCVWAAGDIAETADRVTGERAVHAIWPHATTQGRVVAERILGFETIYEGSEAMNSLRHLGLPLVAAGSVHGEQELRLCQGGTVRKIALTDNRIVGFRLAGDIRAAGVYRSLMLKKADVGRFKHDLLDPRFGIGKLAA